jgi:hypothetical protein
MDRMKCFTYWPDNQVRQLQEAGLTVKVKYYIYGIAYLLFIFVLLVLFTLFYVILFVLFLLLFILFYFGYLCYFILFFSLWWSCCRKRNWIMELFYDANYYLSRFACLFLVLLLISFILFYFYFIYLFIYLFYLSNLLIYL